jgi:hypothetical protein
LGPHRERRKKENCYCCLFFSGTWNIKDCKKALEEAELLGLEKKIWGLGLMKGSLIA